MAYLSKTVQQKLENSNSKFQRMKLVYISFGVPITPLIRNTDSSKLNSGPKDLELTIFNCRYFNVKMLNNMKICFLEILKGSMIIYKLQ